MHDEQLMAYVVNENERLRLEKALRDALFHLSPGTPPTTRTEVVEALRLLEAIRGRSD